MTWLQTIIDQADRTRDSWQERYSHVYRITSEVIPTRQTALVATDGIVMGLTMFTMHPAAITADVPTAPSAWVEIAGRAVSALLGDDVLETLELEDIRQWCGPTEMEQCTLCHGLGWQCGRCGGGRLGRVNVQCPHCGHVTSRRCYHPETRRSECGRCSGSGQIEARHPGEIAGICVDRGRLRRVLEMQPFARSELGLVSVCGVPGGGERRDMLVIESCGGWHIALLAGLDVQGAPRWVDMGDD